MPMFPAVFAKGKTNSKTVVSQTIGATDTALVLNNTTSLTVGLHVFTSDASGANCEYLGKIKTVSSPNITVQFAARFARIAGALLWTPLASWQAATVVSSGGDVPWDPGLETLQTTNKVPLHTETRDFCDMVELEWNLANRTDRAAFKAWLSTNIGYGLKSFTCAYVDSDTGLVECAKVKFAAPAAVARAVTTAYRLRSWSERLVIVTADNYL